MLKRWESEGGERRERDAVSVRSKGREEELEVARKWLAGGKEEMD